MTIVTILFVGATACGSPPLRTTKLDPSLSYGSAGEPLADCERRRFIGTAPTMAEANVTHVFKDHDRINDSTVLVTTTTQRGASAATGLGLYRPGSQSPLKLSSTLPAISPAMADVHRHSSDGLLRAKMNRQRKWGKRALWGGLITIVGASVAITGVVAGPDEMVKPGFAVTIVGASVALIASVAALGNYMPPHQQARGLVSDVVTNNPRLVPAVDRYNLSMRERCQR